MNTARRKLSHIEICLKEEVQAKSIKPGFDEVFLVHKSMPEVDLRLVDTTTSFLNHDFALPIMIAGMTGGTKEALKLNSVLAQVAEKHNIGIGVGSQRVALERPSLINTFSVVREKAPSAFVMANIGSPQLLRKDGIEMAKKAVNMINADALAVHLNPLQEAVQMEGQANFHGLFDKMRELTKELDVPVVAKEVGAGISLEVAKMLKDAGVKAIDVGGAGGTSWSAVEYYRAKEMEDKLRQEIGKTFWDWGIPTAISLVEVKHSTDLPLIATGGIRSGLDVAKCIALGASLCGLAHPFLKVASKGLKATLREVERLTVELKTSMFLTGCERLEELKSVPVIITGMVAEWLTQRGIDPSKYARRRHGSRT